MVGEQPMQMKFDSLRTGEKGHSILVSFRLASSLSVDNSRL